MATNLALDDDLIESARALGQHKTKREAVMTALESYVQHLKQQEILHSFGEVDYAADYDYKQQRRAS